MSVRRLFLPLLFLPALAVPAAAAEPAGLGRLLLTPEQRLALARERRPPAPRAEETAAPELVLTGRLSRGGRPLAYWINGRLIGSTLPAGTEQTSLQLGDSLSPPAGARQARPGPRIIIHPALPDAGQPR